MYILIVADYILVKLNEIDSSVEEVRGIYILVIDTVPVYEELFDGSLPLPSPNRIWDAGGWRAWQVLDMKGNVVQVGHREREFMDIMEGRIG